MAPSCPTRGTPQPHTSPLWGAQPHGPSTPRAPTHTKSHWGPTHSDPPHPCSPRTQDPRPPADTRTPCPPRQPWCHLKLPTAAPTCCRAAPRPRRGCRPRAVRAAAPGPGAPRASACAPPAPAAPAPGARQRQQTLRSPGTGGAAEPVRRRWGHRGALGSLTSPQLPGGPSRGPESCRIQALTALLLRPGPSSSSRSCTQPRERTGRPWGERGNGSQ